MESETGTSSESVSTESASQDHSGNEGNFDLRSAAEEIIGNESQEAATENDSLGQAKTNVDGTPRVSENVKPEDILEQVLTEKDASHANSELLSQINSLGAVHNGQQIKIESSEQLKEFVQKGYDYTKKSMALADESKAMKDEFTKKEQEFQQKEIQHQEREHSLGNITQENKIAEMVLLELKASDPEMFSVFSQMYQSKLSLIEQQQQLMAPFKKEVGGLKAELETFKQNKLKEELNGIRQSFDKGLSEVQSIKGPALLKLGVNVNWDKVKDIWSKDASGAMTVEQAMFAAYGKDIVTANESYKKLLQTKNKVSAAKINRNGASGGQGDRNAAPINFQAGNYEQMLRGFAQNL